jgi:hypothetical protein
MVAGTAERLPSGARLTGTRTPLATTRPASPPLLRAGLRTAARSTCRLAATTARLPDMIALRLALPVRRLTAIR